MAWGEVSDRKVFVIIKSQPLKKEGCSWSRMGQKGHGKVEGASGVTFVVVGIRKEGYTKETSS